MSRANAGGKRHRWLGAGHPSFPLSGRFCDIRFERGETGDGGSLPSLRPETDQSEIGITFARGTLAKRWDGGAAMQLNLALEPGNPHICIAGDTTLTDDVTLYNVFPHMHQIGKERHVWATTPNKK